MIGYYGFNNDGDDWLYQKTKALLRTVFPTCQIWSRQGTFFIDPSGKKVSILRAWRSCQQVVLGGGSLFQDKTSIWNVLYYAFFCVFGKWTGKSVLLLSQGVGPLNTRIGRLFAIWAFRSAKHISFRDAVSQKFVKERAQSKDIDTILTSDLTYFQETYAVVDFHEKIGFSLKKGLCIEEISSLKKVLDRLEDPQIGIVANHREDPLMLDECLPHAETQSLSHLIEEPSSFNVIVTMRYHVGVWASLHGIPFLALSDDPKLITLASDLGQPSFPPSLLVTPDAFQKALDSLKSSRTSLQRCLQKRVPIMIKQTYQLVDRLSEMGVHG